MVSMLPLLVILISLPSSKVTSSVIELMLRRTCPFSILELVTASFCSLLVDTDASASPSGDSEGYLGGTAVGAFGRNLSGNGNWGYLGGGGSGHGVYGADPGTGNYGYIGGSAAAVYGRNYSGGNSFAAVFTGNVTMGNLSKSGGSFKIDHPLDPANKYLSHSFVESPDMMNVYNGNLLLDASGEAVVQLPDYFEALNRDFRYLISPIGGFAPVYIAEKISNKRFKIAGGDPGMEVSWQITGIRKDRWAEANRIKVEEDKSAEERGFYLNPELYGLSEQSSVDWRQDREMLQMMIEAKKN